MSKQSDISDPKQLTNVYKKNGSFDNQRKALLNNFRASEMHANLLMKLKVLIDGKIKQDPSILLKNRGKMGALIQGEIINHHMNESASNVGSTLLSIVDKDIQEKIIDSPEFHNVLREELKDIRRKLEGVSDEDYAKQRQKEEEEKQLQLQQQEQEMQQQQLKQLQEMQQYQQFQPHTSSSSYKLNSHRITKLPRFNLNRNHQPHKDYSSPEVKEEKDEKKTFMMY